MAEGQYHRSLLTEGESHVVLRGPDKGLYLYSQCSEKPLKDLKQGSKMTWLRILKTTLISQQKTNYRRATVKVEKQLRAYYDWQTRDVDD